MKISRIRDRKGGLDRLPVAHICFNQIGLPDYNDRETLKRKLTIAISKPKGFGLE
jgi:hypothetical protein